MDTRALTMLQRHLPALTQFITDIGEPAWISEQTGAALQLLDGFELRPPFHAVTLRDRNVRRIGHVIHTTTDLPRIDRDTKFGLPVLSATRTLIDISWKTKPDRLTIAVDSALRDGSSSEDFMYRRIADLRRPGRAGLNKLLAVMEASEVSRGGASWLEREVLRLLAAGRLPRPQTQVVLGRRGDKLIRVDFRFPGTPVVVEALGYRWHRTTAQQNVDSERFNALLLSGFDPYQFTYEQIVLRPDYVLATIRGALARHAAAVS